MSYDDLNTRRLICLWVSEHTKPARQSEIRVSVVAGAQKENGCSDTKVSLPFDPSPYRTRAMDAANRTFLQITFVVAAVLLLLFGAATAVGTMMSGDMMAGGSIGGVSWMWLPTVLVALLGAFSVFSTGRS
jgi:hypothetical protein